MTAGDLLGFIRANWLEVLAVLWGVLTVWLTVRQNIWCWPVGSASNLLFTVIFFREKLYADMALQVIYIGLNCYGWYEWLYGGREKTPLPVSRMPSRARWLLGGVAAAGITALTFVLRAYTDASLPFWDATTTSFSLVAQYMLARKWIENWWVWITVNVLYIGIYAIKELYFTSAQQLVFIWLSLLGFAAWRKELAGGQPASVAVTADGPHGVSDPPRTTTAVER